MKNILVAVGFEEKTKDVLKHAVEIAKKFNSKIWLIHIMEPTSGMYGNSLSTEYIQVNYIKDIRIEELKEEHKILKKYSEEVQEEGVKAEGILIKGPTINLILEEALKLNVDLIVIGSHKHSFIFNALLENTSLEVIKNSKIPLLVVPL